MILMQELLKSDVGVLSLLTILAVIVMMGYFGWMFVQKSKDPDA